MRAIGDAHVDAEFFHRRIEELLQRRPQPMHLVDEEDVARFQRREHTDEIARTLEYRTRRRADVDAQLFRHEQGERGLAKPGRAEEERMIQRLLALFGRVDGDLERLFDLRLADELIQARWPQRGIGQALVLERLRRRYFRASHLSDRLPLACARQRTGRLSASITWSVWQRRQTSSARVAPAGTSRRFVEPQRVQIHSAVTSSGGGPVIAL